MLQTESRYTSIIKCDTFLVFPFIFYHASIHPIDKYMAMIANKFCCIPDCKKKPSLTCLGCPNLFYCTQHYKQHRDNLNFELQVLTDKCNRFQEDVEFKMENSEIHPLMNNVDEWEKRSINKIRQVAQETRDALLRNANNFIPQVKSQLEKLRIGLDQDLDDCEFVDTDIKHWTEELERLKLLVKNPSNLSIREVPTEFITKISLEIGGK